MVSEFEVLNELETLTEIQSADRDFCLDLCRSCLERIRRRIKSTADYSDPRVVWASAALAMYLYTVRTTISGAGGYSSFKAGDITIAQSSSQKNSKIIHAKELFSAAERELAPLCEDNGFYAGKIDI